MEKKKAMVGRVVPGSIKTERYSAKKEVVSIECPVGKRVAAAILGISEDTLDQWTAKYAIPHLKYDMNANRGNRGKVLLLPSDLLAFREQFMVGGRDIEQDVQQMVAEADRKS